MKFELVKNHVCAQIIVEEEALEGVRLVSNKFLSDVEKVTDCHGILETKVKKQKNVVLFATIGHSALLNTLVKEEKISIDGVVGKREVYGNYLVNEPWDGVEQALVVCGSDKRGTIYGIFSLSERIGVSPLVFWGDVDPSHQEELLFDESIQMVSREPSVRYRGFFINDEWPCFGMWTFYHYDGFTAEMYDHIFELLLRLKGNYLWPAMWSSSFALDGPGEENLVLADTYGVIIGNSHHEPCLRASEEWDLYKDDARYGTEWNYSRNKQGLLNYWEDGLKRNKRFESIVTVGMRGERDTALSSGYSLKENIEVLKDIISNQDRLIAEQFDNEGKKVPRLFALYKEVEPFYYGDEENPGLKDWEGLDSTILMLCDDNYGHVRTLPDEKMRQHNGGFGMYYHLDYHGAPISYEWLNSTPLSKIWEQMTQCYEYGVREVWMVNVGDVKGNEFPLSFFMDLAYDFETWGTGMKDSPTKYTEYWIRKQFGENLSPFFVHEMEHLITKGVWMSHLRRPEALNSGIYHPTHYLEADRMLAGTDQLISTLEMCKPDLEECKRNAYFSLVEYPFSISANLIQMHLYAGKNEHYAKQGKKIANRYRDMVTNSIKCDKMYKRKFARFLDGKWNGMESATHIGFRKWNEDGCRYPIRMEVEPFDRPRMIVSRRDREEVYTKNYGEPETIVIRDFLYPGIRTIELEVANDGVGIIDCEVMIKDCPWLNVSWTKKEVADQVYLEITFEEEKLENVEDKCTFLISDGDTDIRVIVFAKKCEKTNLPAMTFYERDGVVFIKAKHFLQKTNVGDYQWKEIKDYGKVRDVLKVFPVGKDFPVGEGPSLSYQMYFETGGRAFLEIWSAPINPLHPKKQLRFGYRINEEEIISQPSVSATYRGGNPDDKEWSEGVLNQVRKTIVPITVRKGINRIEIFAEDAAYILEGLLIYKMDKELLPCYLGPVENFYIPAEEG